MGTPTRSKRLIHWLRNAAIVLFVGVVLVVIGAAVYDMIASSRVADHYPPRGQFVQVGEANMHVVCQGSGSPTLVLQPGIAGGALDWLPLMEELSDTTRVCAFDRLGQDWSDSAPAPRTFGTAADEWHTAIQALGIQRPVVAGHSLGGAIAQIYAGRYDVAGIVLVDGLSADVAEAVVKRLGTYQKLNWLVRVGLLRPLGSLFADPAYTDDLRAEMTALRSRSLSILNVGAEGALAAETGAKELEEAESQMRAPLLIIAAGANELPEGGQFRQALQNLDERYPDSTFVLVPDAKHYVIASHPALVAETITKWIEEHQIE